VAELDIKGNTSNSIRDDDLNERISFLLSTSGSPVRKPPQSSMGDCPCFFVLQKKKIVLDYILAQIMHILWILFSNQQLVQEFKSCDRGQS